MLRELRATPCAALSISPHLPARLRKAFLALQPGVDVAHLLCALLGSADLEADQAGGNVTKLHQLLT